MCNHFYHYRLYQLGPDNFVIKLVSFVPITCQELAWRGLRSARALEPFPVPKKGGSHTCQMSLFEDLSTFGDKCPEMATRTGLEQAGFEPRTQNVNRRIVRQPTAAERGGICYCRFLVGG